MAEKWNGVPVKYDFYRLEHVKWATIICKTLIGHKQT